MIKRWSSRLFGTMRTQLRRGLLFILGTVAAVTITLSPIMSTPANAQLDGLLSMAGLLTGVGSSCAVEQVGWVVCPTMRTIARLADYGFTYINKSFLRIDYNIFSDSSGTYTTWGTMRNIADALFVVAFMMLVYSQLTGRGGTYNIKKLVPKLLIAALLVNVSWYVCIAIIDVTNILGDSILTIFKSMASGVGTVIMPVDTPAGSFSDGPLVTIMGAILGQYGTVWVLLPPIAAIAISVATVCAAAVVLLIMRKVIVAMLILVSPILFVAYLLPNMEKYFFQGTRLFLQLIFLYPIIALLLGTGQVVSATISNVGSNDTNYAVFGSGYMAKSDGSAGNVITDSVAIAAAVMPLLGVWFIFKNMSSIMSTAGTKLSASLAGRRGGKDESKAKVSGDSTARGMAGLAAGAGKGPSNRRQAYSRFRRKSNLGGSSLPSDMLDSARGRSGKSADDQAAMLGSAIGASAGIADQARASEMADQLEKLNAAKIEGQEQGGINADMPDMSDQISGALSKADLNATTKEKDKGVSAKDLFNNLNKAHETKDKDRKFSSGPAPAGSGGSGVGGGPSQPAAPSTSYRAPQVAQNSSIVTGTSTPSTPMQVVAVPVNMNPQDLVGGGGHASQPPEHIAQPAPGSTGEKAKARAEKYLFGAQNDVDKASDDIDLLSHKDDNDADKDD